MQSYVSVLTQRHFIILGAHTPLCFVTAHSVHMPALYPYIVNPQPQELYPSICGVPNSFLKHLDDCCLFDIFYE